MARCSSLRASISCLRAFRSSDWGKPGPPGIVKNRKASRMPRRKRIPFMVTRVTENDLPLLLFEGLLEDPIPLVSRRRLLIDHATRSEEHTSELQSRLHLVCRLLLEKKKKLMT